VVPFTGTRAWVHSLGRAQRRAWQAWMLEGQVAGYALQLEPSLTFATVKGAGHMVPQTSPAQALRLLSAFLEDSLFDGGGGEV
jgi:serine carboxypeptidase-like clade 1